MSIQKKKQLIKSKLVANHGCVGACPSCTRKHMLLDLMEEANIPVGYWTLNMKKFQGSEKLKEIVNNYITNIDAYYMEGHSVCLAGNQGTGKTMSSICILREALKRNYSAYYITASDMLNELTGREGHLRKTLKDVDFLVIDELDSRFFPSDSAKELFSGIYENVFRSRAHNTLPTVICTNETQDILSVFYGAGVQSIDSLNHQYLNIYPVVGQDFRKKME